MQKILKKNKAVIIFLIILFASIGTFISLGYWYSKSNIGYQITGVGKQVSDLDYSMGNGSIYQITSPLVEGVMAPSVDFKTLQQLINDDFESTLTDTLVSEEEYLISSKNVLEDLGERYASGDRDIFDTLNENEKALVILASKGGDSLEKASKILAHFKPITYIGDESSETINYDSSNPSLTSPTEYDFTTDKLYSAYAWGIASTIYTNSTYDSFRIRLRDGSMGETPSKWQNGDIVKASDIAFGISRQIPSLYASKTRYMVTSISNIKNIDKAIEADSAYGITNTERFTSVSEYGINDPLSEIYYGWAPNGEYSYTSSDGQEISGIFSRDQIIHNDEEFMSYEDVANYDSGIIFHDGNGTSDDYSYIQFNLNAPNATFPTMLSSLAFWPINWTWYRDKFGYSDTMSTFGVSSDTFLSNGAYRVTEFDNLYGYTYVNNEEYWDSELVTTTKGSYRMVAEPATQIAMFNNGQASFVTGEDYNSKTLQDNDETSKWMKEKFTKPSTKYMFFNLGPDSNTESAKFVKDPNFRRALTYVFDTNTYHKLTGTHTATASSLFTPVRMFQDASGKDFVDYATNVTFKTQGIDEPEKLEYYTYDDRLDAISNPWTDEQLSEYDPTYNAEAAQFYFSKFIDDMNTLGVEVPTTIQLKYLTNVGAGDPFVKTWQQTIPEVEFTDSTGKEYKIEFIIETTTPSDFYTRYYSGSGYDLTSMQWGPDYLDIWSTLGIFNFHEPSRGSNGTCAWNFWDGSDYTFEPGTYGEGNDELARTLFNDGLSQFYDGGTPNIEVSGLEYNDPSSTEITTSDFIDLGQVLWESVLEDNGYTQASWDASRGELINGLNHDVHAPELWNNINDKIVANLILELLIKDSGATVVGKTESGSVSPSKVILEGDPIVGYETRTFAFDITKISNSSFWYVVKDELMKELAPN